MTDMATGLAQGQADKQIGLGFVETSNQGFIAIMRREARRIAQTAGSVSVDDLREYAAAHGIEPTHSNAWGAIFKAGEWQFLRYEPSRLRSNRGRVVRRWVLA